MVPLYALIIVGYICGKHGILSAPPTFSVLSIPVVAFILCAIIAFVILFAGGLIWKDGTKNMLSVGIEQYLSQAIGTFIAVCANHSFEENIIKVIKRPILYAFILGLILAGIAMSELGRIKIGISLMVFAMLTTFVLSPFVVFGFISLDKSTHMLYNSEIYKVLLFMSIALAGASIVTCLPS